MAVAELHESLGPHPDKFNDPRAFERAESRVYRCAAQGGAFCKLTRRERIGVKGQNPEKADLCLSAEDVVEWLQNVAVTLLGRPHFNTIH